MTIRQLFPTLQDFITARPDQTGPALIASIKHDFAQRPPGGFTDRWHPNNFRSDLGSLYGVNPSDHRLLVALGEAVRWCLNAGLLVERLEDNYGWLLLSRAGQAFKPGDVSLVRLQQILSAELLHPRVRQASLGVFNIGKQSAAVFQAYQDLEEAIHTAAGLPRGVHGQQVAARAFDPLNGPLRDPEAPEPERKGLRDLMIGALALYKNPRSHRSVRLDPEEAAELLIVASQLMRHVDAAVERGHVPPEPPRSKGKKEENSAVVPDPDEQLR